MLDTSKAFFRHTPFLEETTPLLDIILKVYYFTPILGFYFLLAHRTGNTRMFLVFFPDWERRPKAKDSRMLNQGLSQEELFQVTSSDKHSRGQLWSSTLKATCGHDDQLETHGEKKKQERHLKELSFRTHSQDCSHPYGASWTERIWEKFRLKISAC